MSPFDIAGLAIVGGTAVAILGPLVRAYARRIEAPASAVPAELQARLQRMETAIDAIAVEVERVAEGQRFTTRLLAARSEGMPTLPSSQNRVTTDVR